MMNAKTEHSKYHKGKFMEEDELEEGWSREGRSSKRDMVKRK